LHQEERNLDSLRPGGGNYWKKVEKKGKNFGGTFGQLQSARFERGANEGQDKTKTQQNEKKKKKKKKHTTQKKRGSSATKGNKKEPKTGDGRNERKRKKLQNRERENGRINKIHKKKNELRRPKRKYLREGKGCQQAIEPEKIDPKEFRARDLRRGDQKRRRGS